MVGLEPHHPSAHPEHRRERRERDSPRRRAGHAAAVRLPQVGYDGLALEERHACGLIDEVRELLLPAELRDRGAVPAAFGARHDRGVEVELGERLADGAAERASFELVERERGLHERAFVPRRGDGARRASRQARYGGKATQGNLRRPVARAWVAAGKRLQERAERAQRRPRCCRRAHRSQPGRTLVPRRPRRSHCARHRHRARLGAKNSKKRDSNYSSAYLFLFSALDSGA